MKPKLIILSDLWGLNRSLWIEKYKTALQSNFEVIFYDSCELAQIDNNGLNEEQIHELFIENGITLAVRNLINLENDKINVLGFSIGGTIAWKAGLNGLKIDNFFAVSSTRLRYETERPNCKIKILFGDKDLFKPFKNWADHLKLEMQILKNGDHEIYKNDDFIEKLCTSIKYNAIFKDNTLI